MLKSPVLSLWLPWSYFSRLLRSCIGVYAWFIMMYKEYMHGVYALAVWLYMYYRHGLCAWVVVRCMGYGSGKVLRNEVMEIGNGLVKCRLNGKDRTCTERIRCNSYRSLISCM